MRAVALELWKRARVREPLRLLGVSASHFDASEETQLELFSDTRKNDRLGRTLDAIQERYGRGAIRRAVDTPEKLTPSQQAKPGEDTHRR